MRLAIDSKFKNENGFDENKKRHSPWTDLFAFTTNAAMFKHQIIINSPLQSSYFVVKHINEFSFRPIRNVYWLIGKRLLTPV